MLSTNQKGWTSEQLINMGESLANAFCPGLLKLTVNQTTEHNNDQNIVKYGQTLKNTHGFFYF
ncbi:hypothetical protein [Chroococcus sp. FPU101]|uniref:hypothetical protein n=1 Tax=Chroococcus sp. FPU101 TaxID=1974212 RepID=UPI001A908C0D|nr:hypothetical protein [Chroococcus sp. FPU101]GFE71995.1 hypothetical protein CFPU101_46050 [Chroococcus sp. FPU101]